MPDKPRRPTDLHALEPVLAYQRGEFWRSLGLLPSALPPLKPRAEEALPRLFRRTRSVRRVRSAVEATIAVSVRYHERLVS